MILFFPIFLLWCHLILVMLIIQTILQVVLHTTTFISLVNNVNTCTKVGGVASQHFPKYTLSQIHMKYDINQCKFKKYLPDFLPFLDSVIIWIKWYIHPCWMIICEFYSPINTCIKNLPTKNILSEYDKKYLVKGTNKITISAGTYVLLHDWIL